MGTKQPAGLARIDFDGMRDIAREVGFDIGSEARRARSCGPGCAYLIRDKRFYLTRLVTFLQRRADDAPLAPHIARWLEIAQQALAEYRAIECRLGRLRQGS